MPPSRMVLALLLNSALVPFAPMAIAQETAPAAPQAPPTTTAPPSTSPEVAKEPEAGSAAPDAEKKTVKAKGVVFNDRNRNGRREDGEEGIPKVRVSNGLDIVQTNAKGEYEITIDGDTIIFIAKPANWMTPVNEVQLPRFFYIHKPEGSPKQKFPGAAPTGPLPASVDFPLYERPEQSRFHAIIFGDTQPRDVKEVEYVSHDVIEQLVGSDALMGTTLGDIVFDDLSVFGALNSAIGVLGIPWYNVLGNHDINYDATEDRYSDETFESIFGPSYYSFDIAKVHFVVLDDVNWIPQKGEEKGHYVCGLGERQLAYLKNDLRMTPTDRLIVLMMHIPIVECDDAKEVYKELSRFPFTVSLSAHRHVQEHLLIPKGDGWTREEPHHHVVCATVCGSWWTGEPDELRIPHATMRDGAPNGYHIMTFDAEKYAMLFQAARRPSNHQMVIHAPEEVKSDEAANTVILVNVFGGSEKSTVRMRLGASGPWTTMEQTTAFDPAFAYMNQLEGVEGRKLLGRKLPKAEPTRHLWQAKLPADPAPGTYLIQVWTTDMFGQVFSDQRIIKIAPPDSREPVVADAPGKIASEK